MSAFPPPPPPVGGASSGINPKALARELSTAVEDERRRQAVDDMKKRAVTSTSSYDEFANLVKCAEDDLKPLDPGETFVLSHRIPTAHNAAAAAGGVAAASARSHLAQIGGVGETPEERARREGDALRELGARIAAKKRDATSTAGSGTAGGAGRDTSGAAIDDSRSTQGKAPTQVPVAALQRSKAPRAKTGKKTASKLKGGHAAGLGGDELAVPSRSASALPRNSHEFIRHWRRTCPDSAARYALLMSYTPGKLRKVFRTEVDGSLLAQLLKACEECFGSPSSAAAAPRESGSLTGEAEKLAALLVSLGSTGRFVLTVDLLSAAERSPVAPLIGKLRAAAPGCAAVDEVETLYAR